MSRPYLFVSYSRADAKLVLRVVEEVREQFRQRSLDIVPWVDVANLEPGQSWAAEIERALKESIGVLVFVSPSAMRSAWVSRELISAATALDRLIVPVILQHVPHLPKELAERQWIDLSGSHTKADLAAASRGIADAVAAHAHIEHTQPPVAPSDVPNIASEIANGVRQATGGAETAGPPQSIFLVHGHDKNALSELKNYLVSVGVRPIVLSEVGGSSQSLLQKFFASATEARFAVVIMSADDLGASRLQYDEPGVADLALQFRSRQNVMLELGFFYGYLGWEKVFVLQCRPDRVFPNYERPSDLDGAVFDTMDSSGKWRKALEARLSAAGFGLTKS